MFRDEEISDKKHQINVVSLVKIDLLHNISLKEKNLQNIDTNDENLSIFLR